MLLTSNRGATWKPVPLIRTIWSHVRFWGFPVWPPESIDTIDLDGTSPRIRFRDEWVAFEPGGESLWSGSCLSGDLWTVARVRLLDPLAARVAADAPSRAIDRHGWLIAIPCGLPFAVWGPSWRAVAVAVMMVAALPIASILITRRRSRRMCAG